VPPDPRCKIAFIGSHGVGKTTLAFGLASRLKARDVSLEVVHEVARRCPLPINEETSVAAQSWILHTQVAEELVAAARYPVVLCDRSVLDNYVYLLLAAGEREPLATLVGHWMATYQMLVHVPIIGRLQPDGIRAADPAFQRLVEERLERELERRGLTPLRLDPQARESWLDVAEAAAWNVLRPAQLQLL
jgi:nicotinamide riboside kinase